ncbi:response regulator transcription factor [Acidipila sp. EB88]|uniref:response regulator transcription factor n=1 Tax=Acidipila sp. EB88 TaxID=2305226 RepID=UPI000F5F78B9|nr:response regulator [Acidipila sp. EB88]RRA49275.1 response regulator [Acidipila sp. EB88]
MDQIATIIVVDDDQSVRESLPELIQECGYQSRSYASAEEYLSSADVLGTSCLILDMAMPRMSGWELQRMLRRVNFTPPIIFITATQNDAIRQAVIEEGAVACLMKPFHDRELLEAIGLALGMSGRRNA